MTSPSPDILPFPLESARRIEMLEHVLERAAKALDEERERADAWEARCQRMTTEITKLYEAFGVRLVEIEEAQDKHAQMLTAHELTLGLQRTPAQVDDMNDQREHHAAHRGDY